MARQISLVFVTFLTVASSVAAIIHESLCPNLTENAVDLGYAKYVSSTNGLGVNEFLGMRFAAPPLGDLRFRAPQDALPENETIKADKYGPVCLPVHLHSFIPSTPADEDCLFINVFSPNMTTHSSLLPVVIWIQGGSHNTNFDANFNGSSLIRASDNNMVVVTFNYRVGPYGFLASEDIRNEGDLNVGLLDQRKAMEWTKKNIALFGGNPEHIVLMGTSSGAGSVLYHLAAYNGKPTDLFVGAIASSSWLTHVLPVSDIEFQYRDLLRATNCSDVTCLRGLPGKQLQAANIAWPNFESNESAAFTYAPCIDGSLFTDTPVSMIKSGNFVSVPLLLGNTEDEGTVFNFEANTTKQASDVLKAQYPPLTAKDLHAIHRIYPFDAAHQYPNHTPFFASLSAAYGEGIMTCPSLDVARAMSSRPASAAEVWNYRFNVRDPANIASGLGVPHTWEIDAVWGPGFAANPKGSNSYSNGDASIVPVVQGYWQSFIRSLNPNTYRAEGSPEWERFMTDNWLLIQTNATRMATQNQTETDRCQFWSSISASALSQ
ncbi:hypothetical protein ACHAPC_008981 [Botrytis cinerea]